jgi:hypothetical protein
MGRDKPKKRMNMQQKSAYLREQASKYGISQRDYQDDEGNAKNRLGSFTGQNLEESVIKAMNNDYDLRESLKYGVDSGNKHFKGLGKNISNINEAVNVHRAAVNYGQKELGHKKTSSANDFGNISHSLFNKSRSGLTKDMSPEKQQENAQNNAPAELSTELKDAKEIVQAYDNRKSDVFKKDTDAGDADEQRKTAANSFLDKYKLDIKSEMSPVFPT